MFLSSEAAAYRSSVVMFNSVPGPIGISSPLRVSPVRISGPFYTLKISSAAVYDISQVNVQADATNRIERNGQRPARLNALGFSGIVDDGLMILYKKNY